MIHLCKIGMFHFALLLPSEQHAKFYLTLSKLLNESLH